MSGQPPSEEQPPPVQLPFGQKIVGIEPSAALNEGGHLSKHGTGASLSETTPLLNDGRCESSTADPEAGCVPEQVKTTWSHETKLLGRNTTPLVLQQVLGSSLMLSSMLSIGHLGTKELGGISLGVMSANITGYAFIQGLCTALDTLCSQAYGSGNKLLVGLQLQRMVFFLWLMLLPVSALWIGSPWILRHLVPDPDVANYAGTFLRITIMGMFPYAVFESGKHYLQAQGIFTAGSYALLVAAPINAFLNWFLVWHLGWGYIGAPIAAAIVNSLFPLILVGYIFLVAGKECWPGFTWRAFHGWGPMIQLAIPSLFMVEAETFALEILTLASGHLGTVELATQAVVTTIDACAWQLPFSLGIAISTRIGNLIGAASTNAAKTTAKVGMLIAVCIGIFNSALTVILKEYTPRLVSSDPLVWELATNVLSVCAVFQFFDAICTDLNGVLRGLGRQKIGGYACLVCYYVVALPISFYTAFYAGWGLYGLWAGVIIALFLIAIIESIFIYRTNWEKSVEDAQKRDESLQS